MERKKKNPKKKFVQWIKQLVLIVFKGLNTIPGCLKRYILGSLAFLLALIFFLSFFDLAGRGGEALKSVTFSYFGHAVYVIPLLFIIAAIVFILVLKKIIWIGISAIAILSIGISASLNLLRISHLSGGRIGCWIVQPLVNLFGELVSFFFFLILIAVGTLGLWYVLDRSLSQRGEKEGISGRVKNLLSSQRFKVLRIEPETKIRIRRQDGKIEEEKREGIKEADILGAGIPKSVFPPLNLLSREKEKSRAGDIRKNASIIKKTLENFGLDVSIAEVNMGPTVTQYSLKPPEGVKLSRITGLSNNLALALAAHPIRIEAPIPGRSLVGIEVPNERRGIVSLRELIAELRFQKESRVLGFVLGKDVAGDPVFSDLTCLPHLLVAGATGTGKTIFLNSLILSLLYKNTPRSLRIILIDPKRVEFSVYNDLPHLLIPVLHDADQVVGVLSWLVEEMQRRFSFLSRHKCRDIILFNKKTVKEKKKPLPYIVLIIDELADLIMTRGKELEEKIVRIAQMARAVGIHLVIATQRPSVEVITGLIKANITTRISFQVPTQIDSRTVLDMSGAEKLLGLGDMLYTSAQRVKPRRLQGPYISDKEVKRVVEWVEKTMTSLLPPEDEASMRLREFLEKSEAGIDVIDGMERDSLYEEARKIVIRSRKGSASLLQRRLRVGYVRAARILDMLESEGIVGPADGAKPRKVLVADEDEDLFE